MTLLSTRQTGPAPMEEEPEFRYGAGQELPGGIVAVHTPGPEPAHYAFWREAPPAVVFSADLIMREDDDAPEFVPAEYHDDPAATHDSLRRLLQLPFEVFCMAHGEPLTSARRGALQKLLYYAADVITFDLAPPLQTTGSEALKKSFEAWFPTFRGPVGYEVRDLCITTSDDVAFCRSLNRISGARTDGEEQTSGCARPSVCARSTANG